jgi:hypothetical protein
MKRCVVTAIAPDGRRTSCEVEAKSRNHAVLAYNYQAISDHALIRPLPDNKTVFDVTPEAGDTLRVSWAEVMDWASQKPMPVPRAKAKM